MKMKRIINYRPMAVAAIAMILGIVCAAAVSGADKFFRLIPIAAAVAAIIFMVAAGFKRSFKATKSTEEKIAYEAAKRKGRTLAAFLYIPVIFLVGIFAFSAAEDIYESKRIAAKDAEVTGMVSSPIYVEIDEGYAYFLMEDVKVNGEKSKLNFIVYERISSSVPYEQRFSAGDRIRFFATVETPSFEAFDTMFASRYQGDTLNRVTVASAKVEALSEGELPFFERVVYNAKRNIAKYTKPDTAAIANAMLFGDKRGISDSLYDDIASSGLAHVLAVSGLHVGFLAAVVVWLMKKAKAKGIVTLLVTLGVLVVYGAVCGFAPSVQRAIIMAAVFLSGDAFGFKNDSLSSLSLAAIIVLFLTPVSLFSLSFLLSFGAVLGIILFYKSFFKVFKWAGKTIGGILATSLAANIMTLPLLIGAFNGISLVFMISNVLLLPILGFIFVFMFISVLIVLILPFAAPLFVCFDYVLIPFKTIAYLFGRWRYATVGVTVPKAALGVFSAAYYADALLLSRFVFLDRKAKAISFSVVTVLGLLGFVLALLLL